MNAPLIDLYNQFLAKTGEPAAAAILALGAAGQAATGPSRAVLTPPQVAKQLGCAPETVIGWIRSGALKASNLAKGLRPRYVIEPDDLAAFLKTRQPKPPAPAGRLSNPKDKDNRAWRTMIGRSVKNKAA